MNFLDILQLWAPLLGLLGFMYLLVSHSERRVTKRIERLEDLLIKNLIKTPK